MTAEAFSPQIPLSETTPTFNPTGAAEDQIYARGIRLDERKDGGMRPGTDLDPEAESIEIFRLEQRERVAEGVGLVASRILLDGTLGEIDSFNMVRHMVSSHNKRTSGPEKATPFVSFSADPESLAKDLILKHGFGIKDGSDSVVVKARVHPNRILRPAGGHVREVLLTGGLSPDEYESTHELSDFVAAHAASDEVINTSRVGDVTRDEAIARWQQFAEESVKRAA